MPKLKRSFPSFEQPGRVTFGAGSLRAVGQLSDLRHTVFFVSGQTAVRERLRDVLQQAGLDEADQRITIKPTGEPTREMIRDGAAFLSATTPKRIVAVGGGSVMDWCRLAWLHSLGLLDNQTAMRKMSRTHNERPEICLVPTTCGSGAEAASVAVYSHDGCKTPITSPALIADHVVLDGHFLALLDEGTLEHYLSDALSHAIEAFVSIVPCYMAKEMALSALSIILQNHQPAAGEAGDTTQRNERFMEAGYFGGLSAAHCSVGVVHALAHSLAAHGVRHGVANAVGLIAGIRMNAETPAMRRLVQRMDLQTVDQLVQRIRPITQRATRSADTSSLLRALSNEPQRSDILQRMQQDVCLRTNPRSLGERELNQFLDLAFSEVTTG